MIFPEITLDITVQGKKEAWATVEEMIRTEGWSSMYQVSVCTQQVSAKTLRFVYKGLGPVLASLGTSNFVYFYVYNYLRTLVNVASKPIVWSFLIVFRQAERNGQMGTVTNIGVAYAACAQKN